MLDVFMRRERHVYVESLTSAGPKSKGPALREFGP